jgi:general secretion pathway protein C
MVMRLRTSLTLHFAPFFILAVLAFLIVTPLTTGLEVVLSSLPEEAPEAVTPPADGATQLPGARLGALLGLPLGTGEPPAPPAATLAPFPARLLGTLSSSLRERSVATLLMTSGRARSVWEGDVVLDAQVFAIERDAVVLRRGATLQRLTMHEGASIPYTTTAWVVPMSANDFVVSRAEVMSRLGDLYGLARGVQVIPAFRDGLPIGFRFARVGPDSPAATLGLESGDVIRAVNGQPLDSMQRLLSLVATLERTTQVDREVERAGQVQTHHYRLN